MTAPCCIVFQPDKILSIAQKVLQELHTEFCKELQDFGAGGGLPFFSTSIVFCGLLHGEKSNPPIPVTLPKHFTAFRLLFLFKSMRFYS